LKGSFPAQTIKFARQTVGAKGKPQIMGVAFAAFNKVGFP
jgi:hypothetical protein